MRIKTVYSAGVAIVLLLYMGAVAIGQAARQDTPVRGIYSNMQAIDGEFSGFELIILPSDDGDVVVFQEAAGWPQKPLLLAATIGSTRSSGGNAIEFQHPEMGLFRGVISRDSLIGEFMQGRLQLRLPRGKSFWHESQ